MYNNNQFFQAISQDQAVQQQLQALSRESLVNEVELGKQKDNTITPEELEEWRWRSVRKELEEWLEG